jgi:dihydropteroate synthase
MQVAPHYNDLLGEVARALSESVRRALEVGIEPERICVDPGIGFGKSLEHNLGLLRHLPALTALGHAVLVGASRKSFIGKLSDIAAPSERLQGSIAAAVVASMHGASVVRVHDVKATVEALKVSDAVMGW